MKDQSATNTPAPHIGTKLAQPLDLRNPANLLAYLKGQHVSTFPRSPLSR